MVIFTNLESAVVFLIGFFFVLLMGLRITLESEIFRSRLGLNPRSETFSFFYSNLEVMRNLKEFHDAYLSRIIFGIGVLTILIITLLYFTEETSLGINSNFFVELRWILIPMVVLLFIGFPSIEYMYKIEEGDGGDFFTFKRTGFQWFWSYEECNSSFDSYMNVDLERDSPTYLRSSNKILLPSFTPLQNIVSSGDVIHRWALPSIIMKIDAIPGRMNTLSFALPWLENTNLYGQCSELCGVNHRFMPIVVSVKRCF